MSRPCRCWPAGVQPLAAKIVELEERERQKMEVVERFERARGGTGGRGGKLAHLPQELKRVLEDKARVSSEAEGIRIEKDETRARHKLLDEEMAEERRRFAQVERELAAQIRQLTGARKKSEACMGRLDNAKSKPYREIGACLADHHLAPLNQPEKLDEVLRLRARQSALAEALERLAQASAAADAAVLRHFYLWMAGALAALIFAACLLRR